MKQGLAPAFVGVVVGAVCAAGIARYVASSLQGARPLGWFHLALSIAPLLVVVLAACYFSARRAGNLDPVSALRWE
jgi:ABC-type antimicrobial peptide transport system permease subunit